MEERKEALEDLLLSDAEIRATEDALDLRYGDVDAGKVVEATRKVYPALDTMMEVQRKVLGLSTNVMEEMRKKAVTRQAANETQLPKATMMPSQKESAIGKSRRK